MKKETFVDIITSLIILLLLYTGIMKIIEHDVFLGALLKSNQLRPFANILSILVPLAELLLVASLWIPKTKRIGLLGSSILMGLFTVYVGAMLYLRSDRPCTCGGIIRYLNWHQHFYFNTCFMVLALLAFWLDRKNRQPKNTPQSPLYD